MKLRSSRLKVRRYGGLTASALGIVMKDVVKRAQKAIRRMRFKHNAREKKNQHKKFDLVTDGDIAAQKIYLKVLLECFPDFGIVAEELNFKKPPMNGCGIVITIDPLDGTKAYARGQSYGIGTMISFVENGVVIAAAIGDIMSGEIYYFRPESKKVHRLDPMAELHDVLHGNKNALLGQVILLEDPYDKYGNPDVIARVAKLFKDPQIGGGSIGIRCTRLWIGEIGGMVLKATHSNPWDFAPIYGISKMLGFRFYEIIVEHANRGRRPVVTLKELVVTHEMLTSAWQPEHELLIIHESRIHEARQFVNN